MGLIWQVIHYQRRREEEEEVKILASIDEETSQLIGSSTSFASYHSTTSATSSTITSREEQAAKRKNTKLFNWISAISIVLVTVISCYTYYHVHWLSHTIDDGFLKRRDEELKWIPQLMGWTSAVLYVGSRIPQLLKNWKHKSTEGLSFGMFICAVMGNVLFTLVSFFLLVNSFYICV
jgi:hypothetical protein